MPQGDHYVWHCERCQSENVTLWTRVEQDELHCSACRSSFSTYKEKERPLLPIRVGFSRLLC